MVSSTQHMDTVDELYSYITTSGGYETPLSTVEFSTLEKLKNKFKNEGVELSVLEENGLYRFKI